MHASMAPGVTNDVHEGRAPEGRSPLAAALDLSAGRLPGGQLLFVALALVIHGSLSFVVHSVPRAVAEVSNVTEVELPPATPPEVEKAPPPPVAPEESTPVARQPVLPPAPQAARAGALMTAKADSAPAKQDELVDFVTDPDGTSYGSGVVARGGKADHGERGATAAGVGSAPVRAAAPPADAIVGVADLSRRATLTASSPCAGFYPSEANADTGAVTLTLVVRGDGAVASALVVSESPAGQGFGKAARACLQTKRFEPALDRSGNAVTAPATIKLRFVR